jgi:hypothetical protein
MLLIAQCGASERPIAAITGQDLWKSAWQLSQLTLGKNRWE